MKIQVFLAVITLFDLSLGIEELVGKVKTYIERRVIGKNDCTLIFLNPNRQILATERLSVNALIVATNRTKERKQIARFVDYYSSHCTIGISWLDEDTEKSQREFTYRKRSRRLSAPSHRILGDLLHLTEEDEEYAAVIIGSDLKSFRKGGLLKRVERRFIFAELSNNHSTLTLHAFCPNCTVSRHWIGPFAQISNEKRSVIEKYPLNPFSLCCNPLKGKVIKYLYMYLEPVSFLDHKTNGSELIGVNIDIIKELSSILEFKYRLIKGGVNFKIMGRWVGIIGKISRNAGHIGAPQGLLSYREIVGVQASSYIYYDKYVLSTRIQIPLNIKGDGIIKPFTSHVWLLILLSTTIITIIFWSANKVYISTHLEENVRSNFSEVLLLTASSLIEPDALPWFRHKWTAGKGLMLLWYIFTLIIFSCYNCNLRAILVAVEHEKPIETLQDALDRGTRLYVPREMRELWSGKSYDKTYLASDLEVERRQLVIRATAAGGGYSLTKYKGNVPPEAIKDARENGAFYLSHAVMANTERPFMYENPGMRQSNYVLYVAMWAFIMKLNCPWASIINKATEQMVEAGIVDKILYSYMIMPKEKFQINKAGAENLFALEMVHISYGIYFLAIGWAISILAFSFEVCYAIKNRKNKNL